MAPPQFQLCLPVLGFVNLPGSLQSHSALGRAAGGLAEASQQSATKAKSSKEAYAAGGGSSWLVLAHFACILLYGFSISYDRRAYIETKELRYNGDIFLQNFYLCLSRDTNGRVRFQCLITELSLKTHCSSY